MNRSFLPWLLAFGLGVTVLVLYLAQAFPDALADQHDRMRLLVLLGWVALVGSSVIVRVAARPAASLKQGLAWVAIGLTLVVGYSYRDVFADMQTRITSELVPQSGASVGEDGVRFRASADGHFHVRATVDGTPITFLVDSGASDVVLSLDDARRLGMDPDRLDFGLTYRTANGEVQAAPVSLGEIELGPIHVADVGASVNSAPMSRSLLGMSFLRRLSGYEVRGDTLTLWR